MDSRRGFQGARAIFAVAALVASMSFGTSVAAAQTGQPQLKLDVQRIVIPKDREKLVKNGVSVRAECSINCVLGVAVRVPKWLARDLGLKSPVIGSETQKGQADTPFWVRAPINQGAKRRLLAYQGNARIVVRVRART